MILVLDYEKGYMKGNTSFPAKSLIRCNECNKDVVVSKYRINKEGSDYCGKCLFKASRSVPIEDYIKLAKERGMYFIQDSYTGSAMRMAKWKCPNNHIFSSRYEAFKRGNGCSYCAGNSRKTMEDYNNLAIQRGLSFIGPEDEKPSNHRNYFWECSCKRIWKTCYKNIRLGANCPICAKLKTSGPLNANWNPNREKIQLIDKLRLPFSCLLNRMLKDNWQPSPSDSKVGYNPSQLKLRIQETLEPWMNWENWGQFNYNKKTWNVDHITSICEYINSGIYDLKIIHSLSNLRALESYDNITRNNKTRLDKSRIIS